MARIRGPQLIALLLMLLAALPAGVVEGQVSISGRVVDREGVPLPNAVVQIIQGGVIVRNLETNNQGVFTTSVEPGDYMFKIFKKGYEVKEMALRISTGTSGFLGIFKLDRAFKISVETREIILKQGDRVGLSLGIENRGLFTEEAKVDLLVPTGWKASFTTSTGLETKTVIIGPGERRDFTLSLEVGRNSTGVYNISLVLEYSNLTQVVNFKILAEERDWRFISTELPSLVGVRGGSLEAGIVVVNTLEEEADINIDVQGPRNWSVKLEDDAGNIVKAIRLDAGESKNLRLKVRIPDYAEVGGHQITLTASSGGATSRLTITISVVEGRDDLQIEAPNRFLDTYAGTTVTIPFTLINTGLLPTEAFFEISAPADVRSQVVDDKGNILRGIFIDAGESRKLSLKVIVPGDVEPKPIPIKVSAKGRYSSAEVELGVNVIGTLGFSILTRKYDVEAVVGSRAKFVLEVQNTGTVVLTEIKASASELPPGINVKIEPSTFKDVRPGSKVMFTVFIDVGNNVVPGFYLVPIQVHDGGITKERLIRISVKSRGETIYIAFVVFVVSLVALITLYRMYRSSGKEAEGR